MSCSSTSSATSNSSNSSYPICPVPTILNAKGRIDLFSPSNCQPLHSSCKTAFAPLVKKVEQAKKSVRPRSLKSAWNSLPEARKVETVSTLPKGYITKKMTLNLEKTYEWIDFTKKHAEERDWARALEEGREIGLNYKVGKSLGEGAFAKVFSCRGLNTDKRFAYKEFDTRKEHFKGFLREESAFKALADACYFVKVHDSFVKDHFSGVIVLEYLKMDSFQDRCFTLSEVRKFGYQLISSLASLEKARLIHGDIKKDNISVGIKTGLLKVFDLDITVPCDKVKRGAPLQTLWYRAPEVLLGKDVDCSSDMWSAGCVLTELFLGQYLIVPLPGVDEKLGQVQSIVKSIGLPPQDYLAEGYLQRDNRTKDYFETSDTGSFTCKGVTEQKNIPNSIFQTISEHGKTTNEEKADVDEFWDLMRQLICYTNRLTAAQALTQPFFARFTFIECMIKHRIRCQLELLIGDEDVVLNIDLAKAPHHSMQSFKRSSDDHYTLKISNRKKNKIPVQRDVQLLSGDVLQLDYSE